MSESKRPMGIIYGMSFEDYQAVAAMSQSALREFARSPWHFNNRVDIVPTKPMLSGTLTHCAVLEPDAMAARYFVMPKSEHKKPTEAQWKAKDPNESSKAAMAWWKEQTEAAGTKLIISADEYFTTRLQLQAIARDPELCPMFATGHSEVSIFWVDEATGVYCKARPDHIPDRTQDSAKRVRLIDLKGMADDSPIAFQRAASSRALYRQQAHYCNGYKAATGLEVDDFVFAVVSSAPPILATPYRLVDEAVQQGFEEVAELLAEYAECCKSNRWPGYTAAERMVDLPRRAKRDGGAVEVEIVQ